MNRYSKGDLSENIIDILLNDVWDVPHTTVNRNKDSSGNNTVQLIKVNGKTFLLPDISVFDDNFEEIILRIEVKSFVQLPKRGSPNPSLPLFPIKIRQLFSYAGLQSEEEVGIKIVITVGQHDTSYYWCSIDEMMNNLSSIRSDWGGEDSLWFNIEELHSDFKNFGIK